MGTLITVGIGSINWPNLHHLVTRGVRAQATVIELLPKNHRTVRYEYQVGGQTYQKGCQSWSPNPSLDRLAIGQTVVIWYDPEHPEKSVLGNPGPMLDNETIAVILAAVLIPAFILFNWARRQAKRQEAANS